MKIQSKKRAQTALQLAKAQLAGGVPWGEILIGTCSLFVCQNCGAEYHLRGEADPCAFCDDCKDDVLAILAEAVVLGVAKYRVGGAKASRRASKSPQRSTSSARRIQ